MVVTLLYLLAVLCFGAGFFNATLGSPPKAWAPNWLCGGLMFVGLALWVAPLLR